MRARELRDRVMSMPDTDCRQELADTLDLISDLAQNVQERHTQMNDEVADTDVKLAINNLIWMHGPETMTLREAEELALHIFDKLRPVAAAGL